MIEDYKYLFYYLEKESIFIDKSEFFFQIQSHPDYPTLLAVSDTLNFLNLDNGVIRVDFSEVDLLPNRFITLLNKEKGNPELCFVESKESKIFVTEDKKTIEISKTDLEKRWNNIVLLVEKSEYVSTNLNKHKFGWVLPFLCLVIFLITLIPFQSNFQLKLFFIFPIIGILFSVAALKDLFGAKSELINNFCNITSSTSCSSIVGSDKWKIFRYINFSDLAIVFFSSQFFGLLISLIARNTFDYFTIQSILIFGSIPVLLLSLYFQKFVEKKWCPICLVIISIIILEMGYFLLLSPFNYCLSFQSLLTYILIFAIVSLGWNFLKKLLNEQKDLKENQLKSNRFLRNYEVFKNTLLSKEKTEVLLSPIILGNPESRLIITMITNPFCGYCKSVHEMLENILTRKENDIQVHIIIKTDLDDESEENKLFFRSLVIIYNKEGEKEFRESLNYWFEIKNVLEWLKKYQISNLDISEIDSLYDFQNNWCLNNKFTYTPAIFINGYEYPKLYERENLEFFINELIEDNNF
jgi:thiol-disulfide isomerase/thioredoxin